MKLRRPDLIFKDAFSKFLEYEKSSLLTDISERNTCARIAIYLEQQLKDDNYVGYYADTEYNRKQNGEVKTIINSNLEIVPITADLIVHTRGEQLPPNDNLIAVEVKKSSRKTEEKNKDRIRLQAMTRVPFDGVWPWNGAHPEHVCGYAVGIYIEIDITQRILLLEFYKKGVLTKTNTQQF